MTLDNGPLALALAMLVGVIAQTIGRHARVPAIVLLLTAGVGLGPDGADVIRPAAMANGLPALVGFAVAIILFDGGFSLQVAVLRRQALPIRRLVTVGAVVTAALAALAAKLIMDWDWRLAILFGTLVIVTGPTVVTPLLRRLRVSAKLTSILIAEGVLIDAVGATIAVVALEVALAPTRGAAAAGMLSVVARFGIGAVVGIGGGALLVIVHRARRLEADGLQPDVLVAAGIDGKAHAIAMTPNEHVNLLFAQTVAHELHGPELHVALERFVHGVTPVMVERIDGSVLFGVEHDLLAWIDRCRRGRLRVSRWQLDDVRAPLAEMPTDQVMFLVHIRNGVTTPFTHRTELRAGDNVVVASTTEASDPVAAWLSARGWSRAA